MRLARTAGLVLLFSMAALGAAPAQTPPSNPHEDTIAAYIAQAWTTLSRSMTDCDSLIDPKLKTAPILYLPAEMQTPPEVAALKAKCGIQVEHLPRRITHFGELKLTDIATPGLLYLPNKYVVPGGRFNEMYGWDSYFILLGLLRDGRRDLARGMVENFFFEIEHYGGILNANRTYYFTRSQPPFLSSMIREVYDADEKAGHQAGADAWLRQAYEYAKRDHGLWMSGFHRAGNTGLQRYWDIGEGPVPEMEDDSTYYADVIRWLLAHPGSHIGYLVDAADNPGKAEQARLATLSCDPRISNVCARAHVDGHWLTSSFYKGDRAMRESGFDPSFRWGPFDGSTQNYAPVCLNSLLYKYEMDLAWMAAKLGHAGEAAGWQRQAAARRAAMDKYLWNAAKGMYYDYDFVTGRQSSYAYITSFYPLWAGAASPGQATAQEKKLALFEHPGGMAMSNTDSGVQWDLPFGWAPAMWIATDGLWKAGDIKDARRISEEFTGTIAANFERDKTIREKYNVVNASSTVDVATGYKANVVGFGWTNATYLEMKHLLAVTEGK